jgi:hypothetical protein
MRKEKRNEWINKMYTRVNEIIILRVHKIWIKTRRRTKQGRETKQERETKQRKEIKQEEKEKKREERRKRK